MRKVMETDTVVLTQQLPINVVFSGDIVICLTDWNVRSDLEIEDHAIVQNSCSALRTKNTQAYMGMSVPPRCQLCLLLHSTSPAATCTTRQYHEAIGK
jgi:hypothetical protein